MYFLERPRTGPRNFPVCSEKTSNCYSIPLRRFVFRTETRATREYKGPREGDKRKAVFFTERDVWVLGSTCSASYEPAIMQASVLPLNVPKGSLFEGVATEEFTYTTSSPHFCSGMVERAKRERA